MKEFFERHRETLWIELALHAAFAGAGLLFDKEAT